MKSGDQKIKHKAEAVSNHSSWWYVLCIVNAIHIHEYVNASSHTERIPHICHISVWEQRMSHTI